MNRFPFTVHPWEKLPDAELRSFTSALADMPFGETFATDYEPLRDVRYIRGTLGEDVTIGDFPYRFLERELFAIDPSNEAHVLGFVRKWGVPYCPFYDSKRLFLSERRETPFGRPRKSTLREKLLRKANDPLEDLGDYVLDGWDDIDAWGSRFHRASDNDGFARHFKTSLRESEGVRRELSASGGLQKGERVISLSEVSLALELLREVCGIALALDIANGDMIKAERIVLDFGVVPYHLFEAMYRGETAATILSKPSGEREGFADQFAAALLRQSLKDIRVFVNAYLFDNDSMSYAGLKLFPENANSKDRAFAARDGVGGVGEAMLVQLIGICALETPWRFCASCGRPYKRHEKYGDK